MDATKGMEVNSELCVSAFDRKSRSFLCFRGRHLTIVVLCCVLVLICSTAWGMPASGHIGEWNAACGIREASSKSVVLPLWEFLQNDVIDAEAGFRSQFWAEIRKDFPSFRPGGYGHRIFFHWGFNADPRRYEPLRIQVRNTLPENQQKAFYEKVLEEQKRRNRKVISMVGRTFGIEGEPARALATLIFDIHLLADYTTENTSPLPSLFTMKRDIQNQGFGRLLIASEQKRFPDIRRDLERAMLKNSDRDRATALLDVIKKHLPDILNTQFKNIMFKNGIRINVL